MMKQVADQILLVTTKKAPKTTCHTNKNLQSTANFKMALQPPMPDRKAIDPDRSGRQNAVEAPALLRK